MLWRAVNGRGLYFYKRLVVACIGNYRHSNWIRTRSTVLSLKICLRNKLIKTRPTYRNIKF